MSERWWRRRRRKKTRPWFNIFLDEFDRLEEMADKTMWKAFKTASERPKVRRPYVHGFSMSLGPDGKLVIREFGNVQSGRRKPKALKKREPLVDVIKEDKTVVVVAELPGVEKEAINLHTTEDHLTVSVDAPNWKYHKELILPTRVDPKSAHASYKNGVLEIRLEKVKTTAKGERISAT